MHFGTDRQKRNLQPQTDSSSPEITRLARFRKLPLEIYRGVSYYLFNLFYTGYIHANTEQNKEQDTPKSKSKVRLYYSAL